MYLWQLLTFLNIIRTLTQHFSEEKETNVLASCQEMNNKPGHSKYNNNIIKQVKRKNGLKRKLCLKINRARVFEKPELSGISAISAQNPLAKSKKWLMAGS